VKVKLLIAIGQNTVERFKSLTYLTSIVAAGIWAAMQPRHWPRTSRNVLARQVLFTGVEASRFVALIAVFVGLSIVVQAQLLITRLGQSALLGPILVAVIVRELGPLLTNFVVIGRSGSAITAELGNMKVNGEIRLLDAQGLDPFIYLVLPRMIGMMLSIFGLTIIFVTVAFLSGFFSGVLFGAQTGSPVLFLDSVMAALTPGDVWLLLAKTLLPGMVTAAICCSEGFSIEGAVTEVPQAATRSLARSVAALFILSALLSTLYYLS
jgi:phospholipid/cholesterol/gamma-HCH transport system permease protein